MFRRIAGQLDRIRYYSAMPPRTGWDRLTDAAMAAALLAALASVWLADQAARKERILVQVDGRLTRDAGGALMARLIEDAAQSALWAGPARPLGEFTFTIREWRRGFPFATTIQPQQAMVELNDFEQGTQRTMPPKDAPPEIAACIEDQLAAPGYETALAAWLGEERAVQRPLFAWVFGALTWWLAWFAAIAMSIRIAQFATAVALARSQRTHSARRANNQCAVCSYDLRGLEYSERCPECGAMNE